MLSPRHQRAIWILLSLALLAPAAHVVVLLVTSMPAPRLEHMPTRSGIVARRGRILEVHLAGTAAEMGAAHATLIGREVLAVEQALWDQFEEMLPSAPLRTLVLDIGRVRFGGLDRLVPRSRRDEIGALALHMRPTFHDDVMPPFQRFVYLNALYDIGLSFEHTPLIGCSTVVVSGHRSDHGHTLVGRNFDFNVHPILDEKKAVLVFRETGKKPVLSVGRPGLLGVVTGLNADGVVAVVHGARARRPTAEGEPLLLSVRDALAESSDAPQAAEFLASRASMVSHIVLFADVQGRTRIVERAPGVGAHIRAGGDAVGLTNHFEGPLASDPANLRVREATTTLDRRARLDTLLGELPARAGAGEILRILRDCPSSCTTGPSRDLRCIDAGIATHAVVIDATERKIWVSEGPQLEGRFILFDFGQMLLDGYRAPQEGELVAFPVRPRRARECAE